MILTTSLKLPVNLFTGNLKIHKMKLDTIVNNVDPKNRPLNYS